MLSINLEYLQSGLVRATRRQDRRTVFTYDGMPGEEKKILLFTLDKTAPEHQLDNGEYDFSYIKLNEGAEKFLKKSY